MPLHGHRYLPIAVFAVMLSVTAVGCRQLGTRSSAGTASPSLLSEPVLAPSNDVGPSLQEIPPAPPASAKRSTTAPLLVPSMGPRFGATDFNSDEQDSTVSPTSSESESGVELEGDLAEPLLPTTTLNDDAGLVPAPRDLDDEIAALKSVPGPADQPLVQLDVMEFLVELEQTPSPVKALTVSESVSAIPAPLNPVVAAPAVGDHDGRGIEPWPAHGLPYGIAINPGPKGAGNRVETYLAPVWNAGPQNTPALPPWGSAYPWAGQNSDWGGRQFR